jgi:BolA family transcriptional regulator, general stress-responsive regulator
LKPEAQELRARFAASFPEALEIEVIDDSEAHAGHAGAAGGAGHYRVRIVSPRFEGLAPLARHRLVYHAVSDWMPERIHALSIDARTAPHPSKGN